MENFKLLLKIQDGELKEATAKELEKNNEYYKIEGEHWIIFDYDKNKIRPYVKDLLNRMSDLIEIKWLRAVFIATIFFGLVFCGLLFYWKAQLEGGNNKIFETITKLEESISKKIVATRVESVAPLSPIENPLIPIVNGKK